MTEEGFPITGFKDRWKTELSFGENHTISVELNSLMNASLCVKRGDKGYTDHHVVSITRYLMGEYEDSENVLKRLKGIVGEYVSDVNRRRGVEVDPLDRILLEETLVCGIFQAGFEIISEEVRLREHNMVTYGSERHFILSTRNIELNILREITQTHFV